ncbi:MAG: transposase [Phycisphaerales bacterium]|nr:transposase [Phycisphaerales bacterium]
MTQRGNHSEQVFFSDQDRQRYLMFLTEQCEKYAVLLQGYCLMSNHVHLILTPTTPEGLSRAVGRTNLYYTQYRNRQTGRGGHLWQNRFFSCPMDQLHFFRAMRYVERNPVRAKLVQQAWQWPWSSAVAHIQETCPFELLNLSQWHEAGPSGENWKEQLEVVATAEEIDSIRRSLKTGQPLGTDEFIRTLENRVGRPLRVQSIGRPKREKKE